MKIDFTLRFFSFNWKVSIDRQLVQCGIIVSTLFLAVIVSYWGAMDISIALLFMLGGIGGALILIRQINLGFILLLLAGFHPYSGPGGLNASAMMVALLLGLWFIDMLVVKRQFEFYGFRSLLPVAVFLAVSLIAFCMGQVSWFILANQAPLDAQAGGFTIFVLSAGLLLLVAHLVREIYWLKIITWTYVSIASIYVLGRAAQLTVIDQIYLYGFTAGSMFWVWLVALTLSQALFNTRLKKQIRVLLLAIVALTFYVAIIQAGDWKSGWLPPLAAVAVLLTFKFRRLLILVVPFALFAAYSLAIGAISAEEYSWGTRLDAWLIVLEISKQNPLFGLGFGNYYWYTPLFSIRGWFVQFNSHSQYIDLIAQVGYLGLLSYLWIFFEIGRSSLKLINRLPDGFARSYSYAVFAGVVGSLVAGFLVDWILPFAYNIGFAGFRSSMLLWLFFGGMVSVEQIYLEKTKV
ncbi:MAG: hypothetical protein AB1649_30215 [Chloroflexota bacterium]